MANTFQLSPIKSFLTDVPPSAEALLRDVTSLPELLAGTRQGGAGGPSGLASSSWDALIPNQGGKVFLKSQPSHHLA